MYEGKGTAGNILNRTVFNILSNLNHFKKDTTDLLSLPIFRNTLEFLFK